MNRVASRHGTFGSPGGKSRHFAPSPRQVRGFTLLEMVMVLLVIAILAGLSIPSMQSAFTEQAVRKDSHQLALMVKTAMIQSAEQHRNYVIDLSDTTMSLHPQGDLVPDADAAPPPPPPSDDDDTTTSTGPVDVVVSSDLDPANKLQTADTVKANAWMAMPAGTEWLFEPGDLCAATRVRVIRGESWVEMSFDALTGNVVNETSYFP